MWCCLNAYNFIVTVRLYIQHLYIKSSVKQISFSITIYIGFIIEMSCFWKIMLYCSEYQGYQKKKKLFLHIIFKRLPQRLINFSRNQFYLNRNNKGLRSIMWLIFQRYLSNIQFFIIFWKSALLSLYSGVGRAKFLCTFDVANELSSLFGQSAWRGKTMINCKETYLCGNTADKVFDVQLSRTSFLTRGIRTFQTSICFVQNYAEAP